MTAKEKAKDLFDKMHNSGDLTTYASKKCALKAVDEAIEFELRIVEQIEYLCMLAERSFKCEGLFWEEVKKEILEL